MTTHHHVIFGTGAIGLATLDALLHRGESVRMVNRSGRADVPAGVEVVGGDARDTEFTRSVTAGARVIYQTLNPPYHLWANEFPALQAGVLAAAEHVGARLVSMENVYLYGRPDGRPFTENHPIAPVTIKGRVRAAMAADLLAAHNAGRVEVALGRASEYFGPRGGGQSNVGDRVFGPALSGGTAKVVGNPDHPHTYTYIPDIGEGLAVLGAHPAAAGRVWHLPNDPETRSTRQLVDLAFQAVGRGTKLRRVPDLLLRIAGLTDPGVKAMLEMRYLFEAPFIVDSTAMSTELGVKATPLETAIVETLDSYRTSFPVTA